MVCVCKVLSIWHKVHIFNCYGLIICCSDVGMDVIGQCLCLSQVACNTAVAEHISVLENKHYQLVPCQLTQKMSALWLNE